MTEERRSLTPEQIKLCWDAYAEWSRHLRTWLVAYGIGAPILFVSRKEIWDVLASAPNGRLITYLFLGGVAAQILLATVNKWSAHEFYASNQWPEGHKRGRWTSIATRLVDHFWIDMLFDVGTLVAFGVATVLTVDLVGP